MSISFTLPFGSVSEEVYDETHVNMSNCSAETIGDLLGIPIPFGKRGTISIATLRDAIVSAKETLGVRSSEFTIKPFVERSPGRATLHVMGTSTERLLRRLSDLEGLVLAATTHGVDYITLF